MGRNFLQPACVRRTPLIIAGDTRLLRILRPGALAVLAKLMKTCSSYFSYFQPPGEKNASTSASSKTFPNLECKLEARREGGCKANSAPGYLDCNLYPPHPISRADTRPWEACYQPHHFNWRISSDTCQWGRGWSLARGGGHRYALCHIINIAHHLCDYNCNDRPIEGISWRERMKENPLIQRCCRNTQNQDIWGQFVHL